MKRRGLAWLLALVTALALTGCGAAGSTEMAAADNSSSAVMEESVLAEPQAAYGTDGGTSGGASTGERTAKRIYTADLELETTAFDQAAEDLETLVETCGGYFQSSSVSGGGSDYRYAYYTIRVPAEQYRTFLDQAGTLCHQLSIQEYTDDVTEAYYDVEGRLKTQQTKLSRLQELLEQAETMEDIITIESAISDTEQAIEDLSGTLRGYDAQVAYSTVNLTLREVYRLSNGEEPAENFGGRLSGAFSVGWRGFLELLENLAVALAYGWVLLVLLAAAGTGVVLVLRRRKKIQSPPERTAEEKKDDKRS